MELNNHADNTVGDNRKDDNDKYKVLSGTKDIFITQAPA